MGRSCSMPRILFGWRSQVVGAAVASAGIAPADATAWLRYVAALGLSMVGGMIAVTLRAPATVRL